MTPRFESPGTTALPKSAAMPPMVSGTAAGLRLLVAALCFAAVSTASSAFAWDPFVRPNSHVDVGNARLEAGDPAGALQAYERAAETLPREGGVHLNRGLALLASEDLAGAREAFVAATAPHNADELRADAYYNLGLAFYQEGDAAATAENHEDAQGYFRETIDACRRGLRLRPGHQPTAWNLELALRRLREEEQAQQEQEEQEQQDQDQQDQDQSDEQNEDQQDQQDQDQSDEQNEDQQDQGDEQDQDQQDQGEEQDQDQQDQGEDQDQDQQDQGEEQSQDQQDQGEEQSQDQQDQGEEQSQDQQNQGQQNQEASESEEPDGNGQQLPQHVERVLDALQNNEENLERVRARARATREGRRVRRDW